MVVPLAMSRQGRRGIQDLKDAPRRLHPRHTGMEARSQGAQRQIKLGRQQQHKESLLERQLAIQQAQADLHCHDGSAERGNHLQHQRREESHPQHIHRFLAELVTQPGNFFHLLLAAPQHFKVVRPWSTSKK